ncbi:helix-turn-helix domain-containing protein [Mycolicibacterium monacense]|uniref:Uncharacterized protein n=1 Tax=Mycolicibacterium monacense TaxID=85693 RepID=A0AAD1IQR0_MYCMB|nr:MarR family transcriptional regulator [Mycolicibacterium monacense]MDA4104730.1 hypothetical protein [Mycolicibacterium monacense DSM 44395]ORB22754.1 MarR family transcriptional regulator [Mycolicibacterium monacense DSM 44395]QHP87642.1 MarR family transcriptional regulator [Mycolicibacterium monacense DSM 44395]BBZ59201.1 hypothetical protein MMON_05020 [Mycolicibacterium monacense]
MDELSILQATRLKGRVSPEALAATLNRDQATVTVAIAELGEAGLLVEGKSIRLTPAGRERLNDLLAEERLGVDASAISHTYNEFRDVNARFKSLVSEWQLKGGEPNTHEDADYDADVLARLERVHDAVLPIIGSAAEQLPRLSAYADKLSTAMERVSAGETTWFTRPIIDSYHTVWFELHEELILAAGLTRDQEAKAGAAE